MLALFCLWYARLSRLSVRCCWGLKRLSVSSHHPLAHSLHYVHYLHDRVVSYTEVRRRETLPPVLPTSASASTDRVSVSK
jgi:hypothetical protein